MKTRSFLLAAGFVLAITFTFSCSPDEGGGDPSSSSGGEVGNSFSYCLINGQCLNGPFTSKECGDLGGLPSNSCGGSGNPSSSSNGGQGGGGNSFSYCLINGLCLDGPFTSKECGDLGGLPNNICNGSGTPSSSSNGGGQSSSSLTQGSGFTYGSFTDLRDSKQYKTIEIGTQIWLAENLNFKEEQIGPTRGSKCYDGKESNCEKYGRLYEWDDALEVCPSGWHLPSTAEWDALISYVGRDEGKKLKAIDNVWRDGPGTDDYGFTALPGGVFTNEFANINITGFWWTATERNATTAYDRRMEGTRNDVVRNLYPSKTAQLSVRCVLGPSSSSSITYGSITDLRDSKRYRTVRIGTQNWMAENLNFAEDGSLCYDNKESNCDTYGRLYNWETARTACPSGWKLPTGSEWDALISYAGNNDAGKQLKAKASNWGDGYGRDNYGFAALPGGLYTNEFAGINTTGYWWTATERNATSAYDRRMEGTRNDVVQNLYPGKTAQLSVRCIEI